MPTPRTIRNREKRWIRLILKIGAVRFKMPHIRRPGTRQAIPQA